VSKEIYISKFGYLTPEELSEKLKEVVKEEEETERMIGLMTMHLEKKKRDALKLWDLWAELSKAMAKLDLEEKEDERPRG